MKAVVLATRNKGKIAEFDALLREYGLEVLGLSNFPEIGDIPETGDTFRENAMIKARAVAQATGLVAVADDSGLAVDALDGAPGVYSARYSGENADADSNNAKLLKTLEGLPPEKRGARFICVMIAAAPNGEFIESEGRWEGVIADGYEGSSGFGYDPIFFDPGKNMTSAQMTRDEKNARSHRGKALRELMRQWPGFWKTVQD